VRPTSLVEAKDAFWDVKRLGFPEEREELVKNREEPQKLNSSEVVIGA